LLTYAAVPLLFGPGVFLPTSTPARPPPPTYVLHPYLARYKQRDDAFHPSIEGWRPQCAGRPLPCAPCSTPQILYGRLAPLLHLHCIRHPPPPSALLPHSPQSKPHPSLCPAPLAGACGTGRASASVLPASRPAPVFAAATPCPSPLISLLLPASASGAGSRWAFSLQQCCPSPSIQSVCIDLFLVLICTAPCRQATPFSPLMPIQ
jgi:hypothetical protein